MVIFKNAFELTGNLNPETEEEMIQLFLDIAHKEKKCVIIISHSKEVKNHVDVCYQLAYGMIET